MTILGLVAAWLGSSGCAAIITALLQRRWNKSDRQDAVVDALKVLTVDRVRYLARCYVKDGEISMDDLQNMHDMHTAYTKLGGNGHLDTAMASIDALPIRREGR